MDTDEDVDPGKPSKEKKKSRKSKDSRRSSKSKSKKKSSSDSDDGDWQADDAGKSDWDPDKFDQKAGDRWKDIDEPKHAADLPSPGVEEGNKQGDEDWPYKKQHAVDGRRSKSKSKKEKGITAPSRVKSDDESDLSSKKKRSSKKEKKSKRKSITKSSSRRSKREEENVEISDESPEESPREKRRSGQRASHSDESSGEFQDDVSEGYDDGSAGNDISISSDSDGFSEDASFYSDEDEAYSSDVDGSIDSQGTYDSAEEEEGYGDRPPAYFETPGMMNNNQEINDLMQKANPEHTDHLMNRVNRRKDNVTYDQNMPMMSRQALMTRQASTQAARNRVDASSIDQSRLGFRNESFHKNNNAVKPQRRGPGRRAPPRSKSSGLGTMAMASRRPAPNAGGDDGGSNDPRARFRGAGASTSMQRHSNKPNNVARLTSGRRGQVEMDRSKPSRGEPRRGAVQRAKSTTALSRGAAEGAQKPLRRAVRRTTKEQHQKTAEVSDESDSDEEFSSDEESDSDEGPRSRPKRRVKKVIVDKQDMSIQKHRRQLHGMMYKLKMSVDMSDLMKDVRKGEIPKSPIRSLLMDEP